MAKITMVIGRIKIAIIPDRLAMNSNIGTMDIKGNQTEARFATVTASAASKIAKERMPATAIADKLDTDNNLFFLVDQPRLFCALHNF